MITIDYTNEESLEMAAWYLEEETTPEQKLIITKQTIIQKLMNLPWYMKLIRIIFGESFFVRFLDEFFKRYFEASDLWWVDILNHMEFGHDKIDSKSAGGFCESELITFIEIIKSAGFENVELK